MISPLLKENMVSAIPAKKSDKSLNLPGNPKNFTKTYFATC